MNGFPVVNQAYPCNGKSGRLPHFWAVYLKEKLQQTAIKRGGISNIGMGRIRVTWFSFDCVYAQLLKKIHTIRIKLVLIFKSVHKSLIISILSDEILKINLLICVKINSLSYHKHFSRLRMIMGTQLIKEQITRA